VNDSHHEPDGSPDGDRYLATLQQLLVLSAVTLPEALGRAAELLAATLTADKVDAFLYDPRIDSLVAMGVSDTPMGRRQRALGLDRLPVTNGGRSVGVFQTGISYRSGDVEHDAGELPGMYHGLGIRSAITVPFQVNGTSRGVLHVVSAQPEYFAERDLRFLESVAHWVGNAAAQAELTERVTAQAVAQSRRAVAEELVTVLAHDLRNYLTPPKGRIDLIQRRAKREQRQDYVDDAAELAHTLDACSA
jgi:GAF domain-containing protein